MGAGENCNKVPLPEPDGSMEGAAPSLEAARFHLDLQELQTFSGERNPIPKLRATIREPEHTQPVYPLSHPLIFRRNQRENFLCRIASLHRLRRLRDCHSIAVESGLLAKFKAQVARKRFQMHS